MVGFLILLRSLENLIRAVGLKKKKQNKTAKTNKNTSYADLILLANPYWHYSCNFTVTESSRDNEDLLYCPFASEHSLSSLMVIVTFILLLAMSKNESFI